MNHQYAFPVALSLAVSSFSAARAAQASATTGPAYAHNVYTSSPSGRQTTQVDTTDPATVMYYAQAWGFPKTVVDNLPAGSVRLEYFDGYVQWIWVHDRNAPTSLGDRPGYLIMQDSQWVVGDGGGDRSGSNSWQVSYPSSVRMCQRWRSDRANLTQGSTWVNGNAVPNVCAPGDIASSERNSAQTVLNLYRWLAGVSPVVTSASANANAQACAVLMRANNDISNEPPWYWNCYSSLSAGVAAAGRSNVSAYMGSANSIDVYSIDTDAPYNREGHRRWILSDTLTTAGFGSAGTYSCFNYETSGSPQKQWVAWPPDGYIPMEAMQRDSNMTIAHAGWSVQSSTLDFSNANVNLHCEVDCDGDWDDVDVPVNVLRNSGNGFGSPYGITFIPPYDWSPHVAGVYRVTISDVVDTAARGQTTTVRYVVGTPSCG